LTDELGIKLGAVECEVNIKVNPVKDTLGRVHALKVFFEILAAQIRGKGNDFFDAY